ncbi:MAG: hypothetical protein CSH37_13080 [Thalassolituus sp.]|nr:MAG: hypothetical protein CSH37_13080 [Thalassolituus sp.]TNC91901.1 MAG: hypothetical protein CSH36_07285 [Thalassolituus sp.]
MDFHDQYGIFLIGESRLGLPLESLKEVVPYKDPVGMAVTSDLVSGGLDLRGTLVPLIDITRLIGNTFSKDKGRIVVVAQREGQLIGIIADVLEGVSECKAEEMSVYSGLDDVFNLLTGVFPDPVTREYITALSPDRIFGLPGVPSVREVKVSSPDLGIGQKRSVFGYLMLMDVGPLKIAVEPSSIFATVLLNSVTSPTIESDFYVGDTDYGGRRIPIVSVHEMLGQKSQPAQGREAFIIRYPEGLLAFAVDKVVNVVPVPTREAQPIAKGTVPFEDYFLGAMQISDKSQQEKIEASLSGDTDEFTADDDYYLILSPEALLNTQVLSNISRLTLTSDASRQNEKTKVISESGEAGLPIQSEAHEPYMIFTVGHQIAARVTDITEVVPLQKDINLFSEAGYAQSIIFSRGEPVPVFCMHVLLGEIPPANLEPSSSILIVETDDHKKVGFMIAALVAVEECVWRKEACDPLNLAIGGELKNARQRVRTINESGEKRTLNALSLKKVASALIDNKAAEASLKRAAGE